MNEAHSDLRIRERNHKPGRLGLDLEVRIQDLGSEQEQDPGFRIWSGAGSRFRIPAGAGGTLGRNWGINISHNFGFHSSSAAATKRWSAMCVSTFKGISFNILVGNEPDQGTSWTEAGIHQKSLTRSYICNFCHADFSGGRILLFWILCPQHSGCPWKNLLTLDNKGMQ